VGIPLGPAWAGIASVFDDLSVLLLNGYFFLTGLLGQGAGVECLKLVIPLDLLAGLTMLCLKLTHLLSLTSAKVGEISTDCSPEQGANGYDEGKKKGFCIHNVRLIGCPIP